MTSDLVVEILDEAGRPSTSPEGGQIVLTDLNSRAMPLIRYRIGDNGIAGAPCSCGRGFPVLQKIWGRAYDVVEGTDGRRYHGEFFMYLFEDLRKAGHQVRQFQVVQHARDHIKVRLVADRQVVSAVTPLILEHLTAKLAAMHIEIEQAESIDRSASGKTQVVRNLLLAPQRTG